MDFTNAWWQTRAAPKTTSAPTSVKIAFPRRSKELWFSPPNSSFQTIYIYIYIDYIHIYVYREGDTDIDMWYVSMAVYLSICLSVRLSVCLSVSLSVYVSVCLPVCMHACMCVCASYSHTTAYHPKPIQPLIYLYWQNCIGIYMLQMLKQVETSPSLGPNTLYCQLRIILGPPRKPSVDAVLLVSHQSRYTR